MAEKILCIDDDVEFLFSVSMQLETDHKVFTAENSELGLAALKAHPIDLILLDIDLGAENGLHLLKEIKTRAPQVDVIMVSGNRDSKLIVQAIREGASDYLCKPFGTEELMAVIEKVSKLRGMRDRHDALVAGINAKELAKPLIGKSKAFKEILSRARCVQGHNANILIEGESGTGKELLARYIHELEDNAERPFIAVNCAAIPETLIESELFGHERGSFSGAFQRRIGKFELASGGDIFLDEINSLKSDLQAKILRVLQEREIYRVGGNTPVKICFRVIAATNTNLESLVSKGEFRTDLFHRLRVVSLVMPPLKDRLEDIPKLTNYFLEKFSKGKKSFSDRALDRLLQYPWPGNVRELENIVHSLIIMSSKNKIEEKDLPDWINGKTSSLDPITRNYLEMPSSHELVPLKKYLYKIERYYIRHALHQKQGDKSKTATALGISRTSLYEKIKEDLH